MAHCGSSSGNLAQGGRQIRGGQHTIVIVEKEQQQHASIESDQWAQMSHRFGSRTTVKAWRQHVHNAAI
eukprot:36404-Chlamydomonas_euryale.AAC.1